MKKEVYCPDLQKFLSSWKNISRVWSLVIIDQLIKSGVRHFNISPGLRNAPLIKALVAKRREGLEPICITIGLDERAAAFRALGQAKASGKPSVLICTSGTALANYFPAVIEAKITGVPLIVLSADRPPELVEAGANQSIDQTLSQFCGQGFSSFKPKLIDLAIETLNPISFEMRKLLNDRKEIDKILRNGANNARKIAEPVLKQVKKLVGFVI